MTDVAEKSYKSFNLNWYLTSNKLLVELSSKGKTLTTDKIVSGTGIQPFCSTQSAVVEPSLSSVAVTALS